MSKPIRPIRSEKEYEAALERVYQLMHQKPKLKPGTPGGDEMELLVLVIKEYEQKHYPIGPPHPIEAIKFRMEQMGLSPGELNKILGYRSRKSDIFSGRRKLNLRMIRLLHEKLNIPAETLIAEY